MRDHRTSRRTVLCALVTLPVIGTSPAAVALSRPIALSSARGRDMSLDAAVIGLAGRVAHLARRCDVEVIRICDLQDRVKMSARPRTPLPEPPFRGSVENLSTATERVIVSRWPCTPDPAWQEWERQREAADMAEAFDRAEMEERLGLTRVQARHDRMHRRLRRWVDQLAEMQPATAAGLGAKAAAVLAIAEDDRGQIIEDALSDHGALMASVLRDAVRAGETGGSLHG